LRRPWSTSKKAVGRRPYREDGMLPAAPEVVVTWVTLDDSPLQSHDGYDLGFGDGVVEAGGIG
jgi:hypothetical protein